MRLVIGSTPEKVERVHRLPLQIPQAAPESPDWRDSSLQCSRPEQGGRDPEQLPASRLFIRPPASADEQRADWPSRPLGGSAARSTIRRLSAKAGIGSLGAEGQTPP